jgi:hypothetical protein
MKREKKKIKLGVMMHTCNASTLEAEAGVQDQPELHSKTLSQKKKRKVLQFRVTVFQNVQINAVRDERKVSFVNIIAEDNSTLSRGML